MGSLEELHMPQNGINYTGVMALASAMRHNPQLSVLNFNDNTFTKRGTLAMAQVRPVGFPAPQVKTAKVKSFSTSSGFEAPEERSSDQLWRLPGAL